jgi:hypothetical protein
MISLSDPPGPGRRGRRPSGHHQTHDGRAAQCPPQAGAAAGAASAAGAQSESSSNQKVYPLSARRAPAGPQAPPNPSLHPVNPRLQIMPYCPTGQPTVAGLKNKKCTVHPTEIFSRLLSSLAYSGALSTSFNNKYILVILLSLWIHFLIVICDDSDEHHILSYFPSADGQRNLHWCKIHHRRTRGNSLEL